MLLPLRNQDHDCAATLDFNTRSNLFGYGGDYRYVTGYLWANPTGHTSINLAAERLSSFGVFRQHTVQAGWNITPQDGIVGRYIDAEEGNYKRLAYRHTVRKGVDVFAVYNEDPFSDQQFSVKLVWVLKP